VERGVKGDVIELGGGRLLVLFGVLEKVGGALISSSITNLPLDPNSPVMGELSMSSELGLDLTFVMPGPSYAFYLLFLPLGSGLS
jgi:hypothetical protein